VSVTTSPTPSHAPACARVSACRSSGPSNPFALACEQQQQELASPAAAAVQLTARQTHGSSSAAGPQHTTVPD
jgi:hypothetical protein